MYFEIRRPSKNKEALQTICLQGFTFVGVVPPGLEPGTSGL
jgi:hypothetical protein